MDSPIVGGTGTRTDPYQLGFNEPVLWDRAGKALSLEGAMLAPNALNAAQVYLLAGKAYPFRWDEALRDAPEQALAMRRDAFYRSLLQERTAPSINTEFEVEVDDEDDPIQKLQCDVMNRAWREMPRKVDMLTWLFQSHLWFGRAGQQGVWGKSPSGLTNWLDHEPVHGDSIQYQWDGTPFLLVSWYTAQRALATDPDAVIPATDRGAFGLRLYKPEYRRRFIIAKHIPEASDYFEGEMSGGVHGVGLRSWVYWNDYIRRDTMAAVFGFINSFGTSDVVVFNFPMGDSAAEERAKANAQQCVGKIAIVMPRDTSRDWPAVEQIQMNAQGVQVVTEWIDTYADRHIRELFVGQNMSNGGGGAGGLEGDGRAELAGDTKYQLCKMDCSRIAEALTNDWLLPCRDYNFPGSTVPMRMKAVWADPKAKEKAQNIAVCVQNGIEIEEDEARIALGFRKPREGKETIGKKEDIPQPGAGMPPGPGSGGMGGVSAPRTASLRQAASGLAPQAPKPPAPKQGSDHVTDFYSQALETLIYLVQHAPAGNSSGGQFVAGGGGGGSGGESVRADSNASQNNAAAKLENEAKGWAARIKEFGPKAVAAAQAVGKKAWELAVRVSWFVQTNNLADEILDTPHDYSKLINAKGTGDWLSTNLGVGGNFAAVVTSHLLSYGMTKLRQAIAARKGEVQPHSLLYADDFEGRAEKAEIITEVIRGLLEAIGVPDEHLPDVDDVRGWLGSGTPAATYEKDDQGHEHAPAGSGKGGQFVSKGGSGGSATDRPKADKGVRVDTPKKPATGKASDPTKRKENARKLSARTSPKDVKTAKKTLDVARSRRIKAAHKREKELADSIGGWNLLDSEPADVAWMPEVSERGVKTGKPLQFQDQRYLRELMAKRAKMVERMKDEKTDPTVRAAIQKLLEETQPLVFFEVKTLLKSHRDEIRMNPDALAAKQKWEEKYHARFWLVIVDDRKGQKHSGHRIHVQPQDQSLDKKHTLKDSEKVPTMGGVLKHAGLTK